MKLKEEFISHNTDKESLLGAAGGAGFTGIVKGNKTLGAILDFLKKDTHICLIDTKIKSNTKPLVNHFKTQRENPDFLNRFQAEYVPCVTSCINSMIEGNKELFFNSLKQLTKGQLEFLRPMITDNTLDMFTADYDFNFGVKISGSGGGGYVLGFTDNMEKTSDLLKGLDVIWL